jgi:hypothetical protein
VFFRGQRGFRASLGKTLVFIGHRAVSREEAFQKFGQRFHVHAFEIGFCRLVNGACAFLKRSRHGAMVLRFDEMVLRRALKMLFVKIHFRPPTFAATPQTGR